VLLGELDPYVGAASAVSGYLVQGGWRAEFGEGLQLVRVAVELGEHPQRADRLGDGRDRPGEDGAGLVELVALVLVVQRACPSARPATAVAVALCSTSYGAAGHGRRSAKGRTWVG
jgi:hypothetical protein